MGRAIMYLIIATLGVFVFAATFLVDGGGKSTATVNFITVFDLVNTPDRYDDGEIETRGTLELGEEIGVYYVADGEERLRVVYEPGGIEEFIGVQVRAVGRLAYDDDGVYMEADRLRPTEV